MFSVPTLAFYLFGEDADLPKQGKPNPVYTGDTVASTLPFYHQLCKELPKIELHRHLTGSLPRTKVREILRRLNVDEADDAMLETPRTVDDSLAAQQGAWNLLMKQCAAVKLATTNREDLKNLFREAIAELAHDNVIYCEYRIGIKPQPTKQEHLKDLTDVIEEQRIRYPNVTVKLLLSVARHYTLEYDSDCIDVAIEDYLKPGSVVCGVELGGVTTEKTWGDFEPMFTRAREAGLSIALHCGETYKNQDDPREMIEFAPQRLGHCVYLNEANKALLLKSKIPVETCFTCHDKVFRVAFTDNVFQSLWPHNQVVLATDNPSFYNTSLSNEFELCGEHHCLTISQLFALARRGIDVAFVTQAEKTKLYRQFDSQIEDIKAKYHIS
eukprot:m.62008 g.62008  ORF g.62008 m.62008 type:complete len:384 (-) comp23069_c0_seq1:148-1299(-)